MPPHFAGEIGDPQTQIGVVCGVSLVFAPQTEQVFEKQEHCQPFA
jgi:hypothetical protein